MSYCTHFSQLFMVSSDLKILIQLFHTISTLLESNPYVIVIVLDFFKAFDFVRHNAVLGKSPGSSFLITSIIGLSLYSEDTRIALNLDSSAPIKKSNDEYPRFKHRFRFLHRYCIQSVCTHAGQLAGRTFPGRCRHAL